MTDTTESTSAENMPDAAVNNTGANAPGAGTDAAENQSGEKTFTQAEVNKMFERRLKSAVTAELKKLTGENENTPTVEELQRQLTEAQTKTRTYEAERTVQSYINDPKNKVGVKPQDMAGVVELITRNLEFDDSSGTISNLKESVEKAKSLAPSLFVTNQGSFDGGAGRGSTAKPSDMNSFIRHIHAGRN